MGMDIRGFVFAAVSAMPLVALSGLSSDDSDDIVQVGLNEIDIMSSRIPLIEAESPRLVTVMTQADIESAAIHSVNDLLEYSVGVDVRQRGEMGVQTDLSVRGGTFDQVTLLLNGVNISSPHTGHLSADFPVSIQDIERIEVLTGPSARVFGTSAFTGVVNIVTKKEPVPGGSVHLYGGEYVTGGADLRVSVKSGPVSHYISAGTGLSSGAVPNSDFSNSRGFYNAEYRDKNSRVSFQLGYSYKRFGANTFYGSASTDQWESNERLMAAVTSDFAFGRLHFSPSVSWNRWFDHYQWHKGSPVGENYHQVDTWSATLNSWFESCLGKTLFGVEMRTDCIYSTRLGHLMDESEWFSTRGIDGTDTVQYRFGADRTNVAAFLEHDVLLGNLTVSAGVLANFNTALDHRWRLYPGIDISYRPAAGLSLFASWNMALRMPTFTDLYYSGVNIQGTENLLPEKTADLSLGMRFARPWIHAELQAFSSRRTDMLDWVIYEDEPDGKTFRSGNFSMDCRGVELDLSIFPYELADNLGFIRKLSARYAHIGQELRHDKPVRSSKYAMEYLRNKLVLQADLRIVRGLSATVSWRWQDRVGQDNAPYTLLDGRISWSSPIKNYTVYCSCSNILDREYKDYSFIEQPGRWMTMGVTVSW